MCDLGQVSLSVIQLTNTYRAPTRHCSGHTHQTQICWASNCFPEKPALRCVRPGDGQPGSLVLSHCPPAQDIRKASPLYAPRYPCLDTFVHTEHSPIFACRGPAQPSNSHGRVTNTLKASPRSLAEAVLLLQHSAGMGIHHCPH